MSKVIWTPQPRQVAFMSRWEDEALYGGAAGGGKSDALLCEALRQVHIPHYRGIIFRRTYPQLEALISRSRMLYPLAYPKAKYNSTEKVWTFPSGAKIFFGNMPREVSKEDYQGKMYDFIAFDELTHFTSTQYDYLKSRNRPIAPGTRVYMRATANPGSIGHAWVKERFITPAPPNTTIWTDAEVQSPDGKQIKVRQSRIFIPSTVFDNQKLLESDPQYLTRLAMLPEAERNALLYGDWDSFSGQVFKFINDPSHYKDRRRTHVIEPFRIPKGWKVYRGFDWGFTRPFAAIWVRQDYENRFYVIRELYGTNGTANVGCQWTPQEVAKKIRQIEAEDENIRGHYVSGIADPAIFANTTGQSVADMMYDASRVMFGRGENKRIPGKMQVHYRLAFGEDERPMLYAFNTCKNLIRTLPNLVYDEVDVEDIDTDGEDHIYDALRYVCAEAPLEPREDIKFIDRIAPDDPLNQREDKYHFYMR